MRLELQKPQDFTIAREIEAIQIDDEGTKLILQYKGFVDVDACADQVELDKKLMDSLDVNTGVKAQAKQVRDWMLGMMVEHVSGWNLAIECDAKNILAVLKNQTAMWDIRADFIDMITQTVYGVPRSQKEDEIKNLMALGRLGSTPIT